MKLLPIICLTLLGSLAEAAAIDSVQWDYQLKCSINHHPLAPDLAGVSYIDYVKTAHLATGRTYRFVYVPRSSEDKPEVLLLHGFPESSYDWRHQIEYFKSQGFGVVVPDLLGYGGTDKPDEPDAYRLKPIVEDVVALLDCLQINKLHVVGHDLYDTSSSPDLQTPPSPANKPKPDRSGSPVASRIANFYPSVPVTLTFLDIGYVAPPLPFNKTDLDKLNQEALKTYGFEPFGYWYFFNEDNAGEIINTHLDSMWSIVYTNNASYYSPKNFAPPGKLKSFLLENKMAPWGGWLTTKEREIHNRIFSPTNKGYTTALNWYKAAVRNLNAADEATVPADSVELKMPVLLMGATQDPIGTPESARNSTIPYAKDFHYVSINAGHFIMLEKPKEVNQYLTKFLTTGKI